MTMSKIQIFIYIILMTLNGVLVSCSNNKPEEKKEEISLLKIEEIIHDFVVKNPEWCKNEIVRGESCDSLSKTLLPLVSKNIYDDLPFTFEDIQEYEEGGKKGYLALFNFDDSNFEYDRISNGFILSVFGIVNESMVDQLETGKTYMLKGKVLEIKSSFSMLCPGTLEEDKNVGEILLPNIRLQVEKIIPISKAEQ